MLQFLNLLVESSGNNGQTPGAGASNLLLVSTIKPEVVNNKILSICCDLKISSIAVYVNDNGLSGRVEYNPWKGPSHSVSGETGQTKFGKNVGDKRNLNTSIEKKKQVMWSPLSSILAGATVDMILHFTLGNNSALPKKSVFFQ